MNHNASKARNDITSEELRRADRTLPVPFQISLAGCEERLFCDEVVRIVPGKRLVAYGMWSGKPVVAKLFYSFGSAKRHVERDVAGIETFIASGIPTPKLLFQGVAQKNKVQVLIFERIADAASLDQLWQNKAAPDELTTLMRAITIELATQHVVGVVQRDLHLNNFLVTKKQIYTLDGGSITQVEGVLPKEPSLDHLALFFAQLGVGTEKLQEDLFQTYSKARGWLVKKADIEFLRKATQKWTHKRWLRFQKKIQRDSTTFIRIRTPSKAGMYDNAYQAKYFMEFIKNPEIFFNDPDVQILKAGRTSTVIKVRLDKRDFVVKRYNIKSKWHWLRRCFRSTRAAHSWNLAQRLQLFSIPTPKPVAYIEKRFLGLRGKSYFVMECIDGEHAGKYFADYQSDDPQYAIMAERITQLFINLAKLRLTHGDLKMTNILIEHKHRPLLIDLDGMAEHRSVFRLMRAFDKEWLRFMQNWKSQPEVYAMFENVMKSV